MAATPTDRLLAELTEWERDHGPLGGGRGLKSTGEAPARIAELKRQLRERGVTVEWTGSEYVARAATDAAR